MSVGGGIRSVMDGFNDNGQVDRTDDVSALTDLERGQRKGGVEVSERRGGREVSESRAGEQERRVGDGQGTACVEGGEMFERQKGAGEGERRAGEGIRDREVTDTMVKRTYGQALRQRDSTMDGQGRKEGEERRSQGGKPGEDRRSQGGKPGEDRRSQGKEYRIDLTVFVEVEGDSLTMMEVLIAIRKECGMINGCRVESERKFEVTMADMEGKVKLMDGVRVNKSRLMVSNLSNNEMVVSFLRLPVFIEDGAILAKLEEWGVKAVSPIKRKMWTGTDVADGTRYMRVKFTEKVKSLPYSTRFTTHKGAEYFRVVHDNQVKVCRLCVQPGHIFKECPEFKCHRCGEQGHYVRECEMARGGARGEWSQGRGERGRDLEVTQEVREQVQRGAEEGVEEEMPEVQGSEVGRGKGELVGVLSKGGGEGGTGVGACVLQGSGGGGGGAKEGTEEVMVVRDGRKAEVERTTETVERTTEKKGPVPVQGTEVRAAELTEAEAVAAEAEVMAGLMAAEAEAEAVDEMESQEVMEECVVPVETEGEKIRDSSAVDVRLAAAPLRQGRRLSRSMSGAERLAVATSAAAVAMKARAGSVDRGRTSEGVRDRSMGGREPSGMGDRGGYVSEEERMEEESGVNKRKEESSGDEVFVLPNRLARRREKRGLKVRKRSDV